jgi:hypothetical protein
VLNSVKHNVDDLYNLPNTSADSRLTELLATTLGFKVRRNYDQNQLKALVAALPRIIKYKGTKTAIEMAGNALIAASGASGQLQIIVENGEIKVTFPANLVDISLFIDLLPYILPAGMTCHIERTNRITRKYSIDLNYHDSVTAAWIKDFDWDKNTHTSTGLSSLFSTDNTMTDYANYQRLIDATDDRTLPERFNVGLLDNTIIPSLVEPMGDDIGTENTGGSNEK